MEKGFDYGGYAGKLLRVNLNTRDTAIETLDPVVCRDYIGGPGIGAYILF